MKKENKAYTMPNVAIVEIGSEDIVRTSGGVAPRMMAPRAPFTDDDTQVIIDSFEN